MTDDRMDISGSSNLQRQLVMESVIRTLLEHQEATRRILEDLSRSVETTREVDKILASLQVQVNALCDSIRTSRQDCLQARQTCAEAMRRRFDVVEQQRQEQRNHNKEDRDDTRARIAQLQERLSEVEKTAAESGGRYGAMASVIGIVLMELIRWVISYHK